MKNANLNSKTVVLAMGLLVTLFGCSKKMDRYEDPPWLGGTNIQTLQKNGNYTIFLRLMEKAKYKNTIEKQLCSLFVPDDDAFRKFLQEKGLDSIGQLSDAQALELFTLHFLPNPVNANHLVYEKEWKRLESATGEYRSLFFRKLTNSIPEPYIEIPTRDPTYKGKQLYITTNAKFVPLFSNLFFQDYNGNGDIDYPFMYPNSTWGGLLQWHDARILPPKGNENTTNIEDLANPTASGFIFYLDRVVDFMPNLEQYLIAHQDTYSLFYDLMQRFASYKAAGTDIKGRNLYSKGYSNVPNLGSEDGPTPGNESSKLNMFTIFLPSNDVLQAYLNNTVLKTYPSIDSVPDVTIRYILQSQMTNRLELKSKFTKVFYNVYGDKSVIDASDVDPGFMCSNGVIYRSKRIMEPNVFLCVPGQLFFDQNYSVFMTMLSNATMITTLSSDKNMTLFAPTNDELLANKIRLIINASGTPEFQEMADDGQWKKIATDDLAGYAQDHIYNGKLSDLSGDGYIEMFSHNYVHYSSNVLTGGLNVHRSNSAAIVGQKDTKNGILYYIDQPLLTKYRIGQYIMSDPDLSDFAKLLVKTGVLDTAYLEATTKNKYANIKITEAAGAYYWTVFAPDNAAMAQAKTDGLLPTAADSLNFAYYHFVQKTIFDDGVLSGTFNTKLGSSLTITNNVNNLIITDASGQNVTLNHADADHVVRRGVVHKITSVLKYK